MSKFISLHKEIEKHYDEIVVEQFATWIHGLFWFDHLDFDDRVEAFLLLLKRLIDEKKVVAFPPEEYLKNGEWSVSCKTMKNGYDKENDLTHVWDTTSSEVVEYIRKHWPKNVSHEDDLELNDFWYGMKCPRIGWIHPETGEVFAS